MYKENTNKAYTVKADIYWLSSALNSMWWQADILIKLTNNEVTGNCFSFVKNFLNRQIQPGQREDGTVSFNVLFAALHFISGNHSTGATLELKPNLTATKLQYKMQTPVKLYIYTYKQN